MRQLLLSDRLPLALHVRKPEQVVAQGTAPIAQQDEVVAVHL